MKLSDLFRDAKQQTGYSVAHNADGTVRHVTQKPAASVVHVSMREMTLPPFLGGEGLHRTHCPVGEAAGKRTTLSAALLKASRVAQAGAHIILVEEAAEAVGDLERGIGFYQRNARLDIIQPANFAAVPDGAEVADSPLPVLRDDVNVDTIPSYGFRVKLSRADANLYGEGKLADSTLASIAMGLARVADKVLLSAIVATNPAAFTLGRAAALGVEFAELRALVGTAGAGAAVGQDGTLRALAAGFETGGVLAELTPDAAATIVGAWNRAGVAIMEDIGLVAERTNAQGDLILTCWANAQALLPQPGAFFSVGAGA